jgi:hypothetical protein
VPFTNVPMKNRLRWILAVVAVPIIAILVLGSTLVWTAMHSSVAGAVDCGAPPFSLSPRSPKHAVFTARLIKVAHTGRVMIIGEETGPSELWRNHFGVCRHGLCILYY